jgi:hypothetical protein
MSHHGLQRALVVALCDPAFVDAMHAAPEEALARFQLAAAERAQLLAVDRRAFQVDRLRARRMLRAIVPELSGSMAVALSETRSLRFADEFFSSAAFRDAIASDRPLVIALADYLAAALAGGRLTSPWLAGVLAIERAKAEARRDRSRLSSPGLALAPGLRLVEVEAGALAALQAAEQHLFELSLLPHIALCDDRPALDLPDAGDREPIHLAVRGDDGALDQVPEPLYRSLLAIDRAAARGVVRRGDLAGLLASVGLRVPDPDALVDDLLAEGYAIDG